MINLLNTFILTILLYVYNRIENEKLKIENEKLRKY